MFILSANEMRNIDKRTTNEYGIPGIQLMENAACAVVTQTEKTFGALFGKSVLVVCGKGNNGGDGFAAARLMADKGAVVEVVLCCREDEIKGDAKTMLERLSDNINFISLCEADKKKYDFVLDGVFGTGFCGTIQGEYKKGIDVINRAADKIIAIDIPSGVNGNTGAAANVWVKADLTVTFCGEKLGHRIHPGKDACGKVIVADIGIPEQAVLEEKPKCQLFVEQYEELIIKSPHPTDNKGTNGKLLVVGGSEGMAGSVCLASAAAMRSGAGLCYTAIPRCIYPIVATKLTEPITIPVQDTDGHICKNGVNTVLDAAKKADAAVIGCGMSVNDHTAAFFKDVLKHIAIPVLLDADGLNILALNKDMEINCPLVMTPHPGEMARLMDTTIEDVNGDRVGTARKCSHKYNGVVVLKGDGTVTCHQDDIYINSSGNPGMATAGSGDVLSGIIGALLAKGISPYEAAACGVYIHGMAGDIAAKASSMTGMIASDIINAVPFCF